MTTTVNDEGKPVVDLRPNIILFYRELRKRSCDVQPRQRIGAGIYIVGFGNYGLNEALKDLKLQPQCAFGRIGDLCLKLAEFRGGEAYLSGKSLTMDEGCFEWRRQQFLAMLRRDLDKIAEHVVMPDLKRFDAGLLGILHLQGGYDTT